jgi:hypothetical protein
MEIVTMIRRTTKRPQIAIHDHRAAVPAPTGEHDLTKKLFEAVNAGLSAAGLMMREGTIADATIIAAPPSVKNEANARDPDMHQTKKGNQWYFGIEGPHWRRCREPAGAHRRWKNGERGGRDADR